MPSVQDGQAALIAVVFFLVIATAVVFGLVQPVLKQLKISANLLKSQQSFFLAEAGLEDAVYRLTNGFPVSGEEGFELAGGNIAVSVADSPIFLGEKIVSAGGNRGGFFRRARMILRTGEGFNFAYAVQIGEGGLEMNSNSRVFGNVYSNGNIAGAAGSTIEGDAFAVGAISNPPRVTGSRNSNQPHQPFPEIDAEYWRNRANAGGSYQGDLNISSSQNLGPRRINGNLNINSGTVTVAGPIYVTGSLTLNSGAKMKLSNIFGSAGTVIVVDGNLTLNSNAEISPTNAAPAGHLMFYSLSNIILNSNSKAGVLFAPGPAPAGATTINSNAHAVSITSYRVVLNSNATIVYDSGLASGNFSSGPGGGWNIINWREIE